MIPDGKEPIMWRYGYLTDHVAALLGVLGVLLFAYAWSSESVDAGWVALFSIFIAFMTTTIGRVFHARRHPEKQQHQHEWTVGLKSH